MSRSEKNKLYQKYLNDDISKEEMHVLNQYAVDDDFLFDALEGIQGLESQASSAIYELEKRLDGKRKSRKNPLYFWMSAAAGVAIIVFALIYLPSPTNKVMSDVVKVEGQAKKENFKGENEAVSEVDRDKEISVSVLSGEKNDAIESSQDQEEIATVERINKSKVEPVKITPPALAAPSPTAALSATEPASASAPEIVSDQTILKNNTLQEIQKVDDSFAIVEEERAEEGVESTVTPLQKKALEGDDSKLSLGESKAAYGVNSDVSNLSRNEAQAKRRSKKANSSALDRDSILSDPILVVIIENDELNSTSLSRYLQKNEFDFEGRFLLSLNLKEDRLDGKITIIESSNEKLNEEILGLVETFQDWRGNGNKQVEIRFNKEE